MSLSLYHIDQALEALIDPDTGELLDYDAFEQLQMDRERKIENMVCWSKSLDAEAKAIRDEEKELAERRRTMERKRDRLRDYVDRALDGHPFQTVKCSVSYRKSTAVEITNMENLVQWCLDNGYDSKVTYAAPTVAKSDIAPLLKAGVAVDGAEISERMNMGVK